MAETCTVCGEEIVNSSDLGDCAKCYQSFHIATTQSSKTKDCGVVYIDPDILGLRYLCQNCAKEEFPPDGVPPGD